MRRRERGRGGAWGALLMVSSVAAVAAGVLLASGGAAPFARSTATNAGVATVPGATAEGSDLAARQPAGPSTASSVASPASSASQIATGRPALVALVPVVAFWSTERSISRAQLGRLVAGTATAGAGGRRTVVVAEAEIGPLAAALGVIPAGVVAAAPADVGALVRRTAGAIGIVRAENVSVDVRALAVDGVSLFGARRSRDLSAWPLLAASNGAVSTFSTGAVWTLAGGGDVMLDRAVYAEAVLRGKGADFPWNGGNAVVDGRVCCGLGNLKVVTGHRTGAAGAVRSLLSAADVSLVNLEAPAPDRFTYHPSGFSFSADPALLTGLRDAGIDGVSLANNHLGNAGSQGVLDTLRHLDDLGIAHAGAGRDQPEARRAAWFEAAGQRIAVLAYSDIQPESYWAAPGHPGSAAYSMPAIRADIRAARSAGATVVIVMPHWGIEYSDALYAFQRPDARAMIAAGADLVLASHSHWLGSMEAIDGRLVFYSLGDLVFDLSHDERTQEGAVVDLTFVGGRVVQAELHPTLILDGSQPNLLDPGGDGRAVLDAVRASSAAALHW